MTFRKDSLLFYESTFAFAICIPPYLLLIPFFGFWLFLLCTVPLVIFILLNPKLHNEFITIDETGIMCQKSGTQLWAYTWDNIAALKKSYRFRRPSVEVITYRKSGEPEPFSLPNQYFQLGKVAKKAIKQYYEPIGGTLKR